MFAAMSAAGMLGAGVAATRTHAGRRMLVKAARSNVVTRKAAGKLARVRHVIKRMRHPKTPAQMIATKGVAPSFWETRPIPKEIRRAQALHFVTWQRQVASGKRATRNYADNILMGMPQRRKPARLKAAERRAGAHASLLQKAYALTSSLE